MNIGKKIRMVAAAAMAATIVVSCGDDIPQSGKLDVVNLPTQVVHDISAVMSEEGEMLYKLIAPRMERYDNTEEPYELFTDGMMVLCYTEEGLLEMRIVADRAFHKTDRVKERWEAYGHVEITNYLKRQVLKTDTLYWDRKEKKIYTHCFVRLYSPQGYMQGLGMTSDETARNVTILKPYDSFGVVQDENEGRRVKDTANFVGPVFK